jgi:uncharacterized protein (TIGR02452 family)
MLKAIELARVARRTIEVVEAGAYVAPSGRAVSLRAEIDAAVAGTMLYTPADLETLVGASPGSASGGAPRVEVTGETTAQAGRRLVQEEGLTGVVALNFASARKPGGGFLTGARAQEEDLARASGLHACLLARPGYYEANRAHRSALYTDHAIYSPEVPFFRDEDLALLEAPFTMSIVTMPAPNAGEALRRDVDAGPAIERVLTARAGKVLAIAARHGHRHLVLGAWGCGVFRNHPGQVAAAFEGWLGSPRFRGAFDRVVFAVYDPRPGQPTLAAFQDRFA